MKLEIDKPLPVFNLHYDSEPSIPTPVSDTMIGLPANGEAEAEADGVPGDDATGLNFDHVCHTMRSSSKHERRGYVDVGSPRKLIDRQRHICNFLYQCENVYRGVD